MMGKKTWVESLSGPVARMRRLLLPAATILGTAVALGASYSFAPRAEASSNACLLQADAFLHGRLHIEAPGYVHDLAVHDGFRYVVHPPFPSLLMVPLVAIFGAAHVHEEAVGLVLSLLCMLTLWRVLRRAGVERRESYWLLAAFFAGTSFWFTVMWSAGVWYFAHVVAVSCMLLAILSAQHGLGLAAGACLAMAVLSRQLCVYATPFILILLWQCPERRSWGSRALRVAACLGVMGLLGSAYLWMNYARFGNPLDTGYGLIPMRDILQERVARYGQFHWAYLPFNFTHMFLQGFNVQFVGGDLLLLHGMDRYGTSIVFASPFLWFAFRARGDWRVLGAAWLAIGATVLHSLFYHNNGWVQINGHRFTLDFMPVAFVLLAMAMPRTNLKVFKGLVVYAVVLNVLALAVVPWLTKLQHDAH